jgi:hypothetical protein
MSDGDPKSRPILGFLTVIQYDPYGLMGGYLVLNDAGRPLEFHCTAPVKANRAQEILYGPTLDPYLYGEQIGLTLIAKAKQSVPALFTDVAPALSARQGLATPMALVLADEQAARDVTARHESLLAQSCDATNEAGVAALTTPLLHHFCLGGHRLAVETPHAGDAALLEDLLGSGPGTLDLFEPFGRIREALDEAQRMGR